MIRIALILIAALFLQAIQAGNVRAQINKELQEDLVIAAEGQVVRFIEMEDGFDDVYAVRSQFRQVVIRQDGTAVCWGTQTAVIDKKAGFRRVHIAGVDNAKPFSHEVLWVKGVRFEQDLTGVWHKLVREGEPNPDRLDVEDRGGTFRLGSHQAFDPRNIWAHDCNVESSVYGEAAKDLLLGRACIQAERKKSGIQSIWAFEKTTGFNRVTKTYFNDEGDLTNVELVPTITGDFSVQKINDAKKESGVYVETVLKWTTYAKGKKVITESRTFEHSPDREAEFQISSRWILGSALQKDYLKDPREQFLDLDNLEFSKNVLHAEVVPDP